jgi:hypothetical protein
MEKYQGYIEAWDIAHWELTLAFEDLRDEDLWRRAHPSLLSVGELAAHVAYSESLLPQPMPESPLVNRRFGYYLNQVDDPVSLDLTVSQVLEELKKLHDAAKAAALVVGDVNAKVHWRDDWTWFQCVQYMACFHVGYHTGQAFSVRHLMGHKTNDN